MPEPYRSKFVEYCKYRYMSKRLHSPAGPRVHLLWDRERLDTRLEKVLAEYGTDDGLYEVVGLETCDPNPSVRETPPKTISGSVAVSARRNERLAVPEFEGTRFIKRRLDRAAIAGAVDLLRQVLRWFPEDRVTTNKLLDHEWFAGRRHQRTSKTQHSMGPTFDDTLMEDVDLPVEMSMKKENLPPSAQPAGGGPLAGRQTWRLNELDLLNAGPFVPKSI